MAPRWWQTCSTLTRKSFIAFQRDALGLLAQGARRDEIVSELVESSSLHAQMQVLPNGYGDRIPGQWQGRAKTLRIVGDKKAAAVSE
ncbi:MAG: hypothetical protein D6695_04485 [Planctomycetota bacterium]|nr:MAG: hypothetical protein D6695_04485 [Planctomycetota bacterium]